MLSYHDPPDALAVGIPAERAPRPDHLLPRHVPSFVDEITPAAKSSNCQKQHSRFEESVPGCFRVVRTGAAPALRAYLLRFERSDRVFGFCREIAASPACNLDPGQRE